MTTKAITDTELSEAVKPIDPPSATKRRKRTTSTAGKKTASGMTQAQLKKGLIASFELLGTGISFADEFDGELITSKATDMADALIELGKINTKVMKMLESLVTTSAWGGVITVFVMEVGTPIAVHHHLLPEPVNSLLAAQGNIPVKGEHLSAVGSLPDDNAS